MTDWERVKRLRDEGSSWEEIASDSKVAFTAPEGTDAGRALRTLYVNRKSRRGKSGGPDRQRRKERKERRETPTTPWRRIYGAAAVAVAIGLIIWLVVFSPFAPKGGTNILTYCGGEGTAAHFHPLLVIHANGAQQPLPHATGESADIGYLDQPGYTNSSYYCGTSAAGPEIHALHTHDGSGIIHAELPPSLVGTPLTLGDFFSIWGEPLDPGHLWTFTGHVTAQVTDMDTGATIGYSNNPGGLPLYIPAGGGLSNPYRIPTSLIFSSQYGNGASGGTFDGEIIWFNVTWGTGP